MLARVWAAGVQGIEGYPVAVELDLANGLPCFLTVGLPDSAVRESRERVASALRNSGYEFPSRRVTVNLAPAQLRKRGTQFELPVALAVLAATGQVGPGDWMRRYCILGELALDGSVKPVPGVLPMAASAAAEGREGVVVARANAAEAAATGVPSFGIGSLREAVGFLSGVSAVEPAGRAGRPAGPRPPDLADVKGQAVAKRALEVAAAGGHHLLLVGPPGAGKSMLAQRLPGLLPPLTGSEAVDLAKVLSVIGRLDGSGLPADRPFRAPHHTVTPQGLVGGGSPPRPGEASLAHGGVLFLDELPEFGRESLEALRVPLETGKAAVARVREFARFPARFQVVAAMNPCQCGWSGHPSRACVCPPGRAQRYRARVSGPLMDRLDMAVEVRALSFAEWRGSAGPRAGGAVPEGAAATAAGGAAADGSEPAPEGSEPARARVALARERQAARLGPGGVNAGMGQAELRRHCRLDAEVEELFRAAAHRLGLSARGLDRVLKVARTVADLAGSDGIRRPHAAEALALSGR